MGFANYEAYTGYHPQTQGGKIVNHDGRVVRCTNMGEALERVRQGAVGNEEAGAKPLLLVLDAKNLLFRVFVSALATIDPSRYPRNVGQDIVDRECYKALDVMVGEIHDQEPTAEVRPVWDHRFKRPEQKKKEEEGRMIARAEKLSTEALQPEKERQLKSAVPPPKANKGNRAMARLRKKQKTRDSRSARMEVDSEEREWSVEDLAFPEPPSRETMAKYRSLRDADENGTLCSITAPHEADPFIRTVILVATGEISLEDEQDRLRYNLSATHVATLSRISSAFDPVRIVSMSGDSDIAVLLRSRSSTFHIIRSAVPRHKGDDRARAVAPLDRRKVEQDDLWKFKEDDVRGDVSQLALTGILGNDYTGSGLDGAGIAALQERRNGGMTVGRALGWLPWGESEVGDADILKAVQEVIGREKGKKLNEGQVRRIRSGINVSRGLETETFDTRETWEKAKRRAREKREQKGSVEEQQPMPTDAIILPHPRPAAALHSRRKSASPESATAQEGADASMSLDDDDNTPVTALLSDLSMPSPCPSPDSSLPTASLPATSDHPAPAKQTATTRNRNKPFTSHTRSLDEPPPLLAVATAAQRQRDEDPTASSLETIRRRDAAVKAKYQQVKKGLGGVEGDTADAVEIMAKVGDEASATANAAGSDETAVEGGTAKPKEGKAAKLNEMFARATVQLHFPSASRHLPLHDIVSKPPLEDLETASPTPERPLIQDMMQLNIVSKACDFRILDKTFAIAQAGLRELDRYSPLMREWRKSGRLCREVISAIYQVGKGRKKQGQGESSEKKGRGKSSGKKRRKEGENESTRADAKSKSTKWCSPEGLEKMLRVTDEVLDKIEAKVEGYEGNYDWSDRKGQFRIPFLLHCFVKDEKETGYRLSTPSNVDAAMKAPATQMGTSIAVNGIARGSSIRRRLLNSMLNLTEPVTGLFEMDPHYRDHAPATTRTLVHIIAIPPKNHRRGQAAIQQVLDAFLTTTSLDSPPSVDAEDELVTRLVAAIKVLTQKMVNEPHPNEVEKVARALARRAVGVHGWARGEADWIDGGIDKPQAGAVEEEPDAETSDDEASEVEHGKGRAGKKRKRKRTGTAGKGKDKARGREPKRPALAAKPRGNMIGWQAGESRLDAVSLELMYEEMEFRLKGEYPAFSYNPGMWPFDIAEEVALFCNTTEHPEALTHHLSVQLKTASEAERIALETLVNETLYLELVDNGREACSIRLIRDAKQDGKDVKELVKSTLGCSLSDAGHGHRMNLISLFFREVDGDGYVLSGTGCCSARRVNLAVFKTGRIQQTATVLGRVSSTTNVVTRGELLTHIVKEESGSGTYAKPIDGKAENDEAKTDKANPGKKKTAKSDKAQPKEKKKAAKKKVFPAVDQIDRTTHRQRLAGIAPNYARVEIKLPFNDKGEYQGTGATKPFKLLQEDPRCPVELRWIPGPTTEPSVRAMRKLINVNEETGEGDVDQNVAIAGVDPGQVKTMAIWVMLIGGGVARFITVSGGSLATEDRQARVIMEAARAVDVFVDQAATTPSLTRKGAPLVNVSGGRSFSRSEEKQRDLDRARKRRRSSRYDQIVNEVFPRRDPLTRQKVILVLGSGFGSAGVKGKGVRRPNLEQKELLKSFRGREDLDVVAVIADERWTSQMDPSPARRAQPEGMNRMLEAHFEDGSTAHRIKQAAVPVPPTDNTTRPERNASSSSPGLYPVMHRDEVGAQNAAEKALHAAITGLDLYPEGPADVQTGKKGEASDETKGKEKGRGKGKGKGKQKETLPKPVSKGVRRKGKGKYEESESGAEETYLSDMEVNSESEAEEMNWSDMEDDESDSDYDEPSMPEASGSTQPPGRSPASTSSNSKKRGSPSTSTSASTAAKKPRRNIPSPAQTSNNKEVVVESKRPKRAAAVAAGPGITESAAFEAGGLATLEKGGSPRAVKGDKVRAKAVGAKSSKGKVGKGKGKEKEGVKVEKGKGRRKEKMTTTGAKNVKIKAEKVE
ncbi:hypothetical protein JCM11641_005132 [Rhodosporidiobolus odoratus]